MQLEKFRIGCSVVVYDFINQDRYEGWVANPPPIESSNNHGMTIISGML